MSKTFFISAGEVSGDLYAAGLLKALVAQAPEIQAYGLGGPLLQAAGLRLLADVRPLSAVGLSENLASLPVFWRLRQRLQAWLRQNRPAAVILIDFQGFNLQLAQVAKALGIPVIYFIAPQEWIWGVAGGLERIRASVDLILAVFEPEARFYAQAGLRVEFAGHPLLDLLPEPRTPAQARQLLGLNPQTPTLCLMPGSRRHELRRLAPILQAVQAYLPPETCYLLPQAAEFLDLAELRSLKAQRLALSQRYLAMQAADAVLGASGSMILEAALLARPVVALYRVSGLTYAVARRLVRLPWISLPNILLQQALVPEFIQHLEPEQIARSLLNETRQQSKWKNLPQRLETVLGQPGSFERAARALLDFVG